MINTCRAQFHVHAGKLLLTLIIMPILVGCGQERIKPEDFPRRDSNEVIVGNTPSKPSVPAENDPPETFAAETTAASGEAFRQAAAEGNVAELKRLAEDGISVDAADEGGRTALQLACFDGHLEAVQWLIEQKANVNHYDESGRTPLMYAATADNASTVKTLLAAGAQVDSVDREEQFTALMYAAAEGQAEVVRILLDRGADATRRDADGETALDFAAAKNHDAVVDLLQ